MDHPAETDASDALDQAHILPVKNRVSYVAMLAAQGANAFTDNFVKMLIISFAGVTAAHTFLGEYFPSLMGAIFAIPYILFAPVAGWLNDRFSKQRVFLLLLMVQTVAFSLFLGALSLHQTELTLQLSLLCFFVVATQSAFFSPAKFGILRELIGSRRIGSGSGWLQMLNMGGTLLGMWAGPAWFKTRLESSAGDPWQAVWLPMMVMTVCTVIPVGLALLIQGTPSHPGLSFQRSIWWEHISNCKLAFKERSIKLATLGICYFWFLANAIGTILLTLSKQLHPHDQIAQTQANATMPGMLGIGILIGSLMAGFISRKRIELGLVPLSGLVLSASLFVVGGFAEFSWLLHGGLIVTGIAGGSFMTPLYAFIQDRAKPDERARVLASVGLLDSISALSANVLFVMPLLALKVPAYWQLLILVPITLAAALYITKLLPRSLLMLVGSGIIRSIYRIKMKHAERMPKEGPLLILPNHVSYADALVLGASAERDVRFVMLDTFYKMKSIQWALKLFGSVPISPGKAKEAIQTVATALQQDQAVVLYPEGQLTRTGFVNEIHKGFEIMARRGGGYVQPVWLDGLWGSLFSFEGGKFFKKAPKGLPYPITAWYGEPIEAAKASTRRVQLALYRLSAEAFAHRKTINDTPTLTSPEGSRLPAAVARAAHINTLRLLDTSLLHHCDAILCLLPPDHPMMATFGIALAQGRGLPVHRQVSDLTAERHSHVLCVKPYDSALPDRLPGVAFTLLLMDAAVSTNTAPPPTRDDSSVALYDASTGMLLSAGVPHPPLPEKEVGNQTGTLPGSYGRLLPGIGAAEDTGRLMILQGVQPESNAEYTLHLRLDEQGFFLPVPLSQPTDHQT